MIIPMYRITFCSGVLAAFDYSYIAEDIDWDSDDEVQAGMYIQVIAESPLFGYIFQCPASISVMSVSQ
jgi:hypothetical protein